MMNYIAVSWINFLIFACLDRRRFPDVAQVPAQRLAAPADWITAQPVPAFRGLTTHLGLLIGIVAAVIVWLIIYRSRWGYEIRLIGDNPHAARYAGHQHHPQYRPGDDALRRAGRSGGMSEDDRGGPSPADLAISPGYGFTGIIIAWLAKLNPWWRSLSPSCLAR